MSRCLANSRVRRLPSAPVHSWPILARGLPTGPLRPRPGRGWRGAGDAGGCRPRDDGPKRGAQLEGPSKRRGFRPMETRCESVDKDTWIPRIRGPAQPM